MSAVGKHKGRIPSQPFVSRHIGFFDKFVKFRDQIVHDFLETAIDYV